MISMKGKANRYHGFSFSSQALFHIGHAELQYENNSTSSLVYLMYYVLMCFPRYNTDTNNKYEHGPVNDMLILIKVSDLKQVHSLH